MTTQEYESMAAREATASASSRLFSFSRIRDAGTPTRFYPGDGAKLHYANRDVDTLELPGLPSGYLAAGDVVTATYKGVCVFRGDVATIVEHKGRGTDATQTVTCVGPWSKMSRLVYRQGWYTGSGYSLSSRLVLNMYQDGTAQNLNSELREIAQHGTTSCGYSVNVNDISVSTQHLPFDECRDITVADAIKRELRFFPKATVRFDYSGSTPALKIEKNANPTTASYVADVPKTSREYVYNAHPITGVDLEIEATGTIEGVEYRQITHQTAGNTLAGNPDCLYATLQIKGASANTTRQSFKSVTEDLPEDLNDAEWWKQKHPRLANVATSAITISGASRTITDATCVRIAKATAGELEEAGLKCEVSKFTATATIETADDKEETIYLTLNFLMTNATGTAEEPKTYTWVSDSSGESGETVPAGLAATILAERSGTLQGERMTVRLGDTFPRVGDALVESSSSSASSRDETLFLQQIDIDCGDLTADLSFGVPEYLTPEDMASLLSGFRNKRTAASATIRKTGKTTDGGADVEMGGIPPLSSSEFAPGTKAKTTIKGSGSGAQGSGSIKLDSSEVSSGKEIAVHKLTVKTGGTDGTDGTGETEYQILSEKDVEIPSGVTSANGESGAITIVGEGKIKVTTDGKTIKISLSEDDGKGEGDGEGVVEDPCEHPGGGGGVAAGGGGGGDGGGGGGGGDADGSGGVPAEGDAHPGKPCTEC